jgi:hypothetical protein
VPQSVAQADAVQMASGGLAKGFRVGGHEGIPGDLLGDDAWIQRSRAGRAHAGSTRRSWLPRRSGTGRRPKDTCSRPYRWVGRGVEAGGIAARRLFNGLRPAFSGLTRSAGAMPQERPHRKEPSDGQAPGDDGGD